MTSGSLLGCFRPRAKLMGIAFGSAIDRRCLLKASLVAGVAVVARPIMVGAQSPAFDTHASASGSEWRRTPATAARPNRGRPKVTGAKVYAADFRAVDMPGWPPDTAHAMLLKALDATHIFQGIDLAGGSMRSSPPIGLCWPMTSSRPASLCQSSMPVIFSALRGKPRLSRAAGRAPDLERLRPLRGRPDDAPVPRERFRFGPETGPVAEEPYAAARFVRVAGPSPDSGDIYSPMLAGWTFPILYQKR